MSENKENLLDDIKTIVDGIFSEKEKASQIAKTQDALNTSATVIEDLTNKLEDTKAELEIAKTDLTDSKATASTDLEEKDSKISEVTSELEAAKKELEEITKELSAIKETLENLNKDRVAETRMKELEEAKVIVATAIGTQTTKVREMCDEEFATYKQERVELREAIEKELENASSGEENVNDGAEDGVDESTVSDDANLENASFTPAPVINPGQAAASAMNFEVEVSADVKEKYKNLGKAMASKMSPAKSNK